MVERDRGIDEWRPDDQITRNAVVEEVGSAETPVGVVRRREVLEAKNGQTGELTIRNPGIVDAVSSPNHGLVVVPVGEAETWAPSILGRLLELPRAGAPKACPCEELSTQSAAGARVRCVDVKARVLIVGLDPGRLVVKPQTESERQVIGHLTIHVHPGRGIPLVEGRLGRNVKGAVVHLT